MAIYRPGEVVSGRYRIQHALSQGGMGAVYLGEQISLGRPVALKVILPHHEDHDALRARFEHEARAVCQLHHPNIITYHDYGHDEDGRPYLVMEYLQGYPGTDFVYNPPVPTLEACAHVLGQLASALAEAHARGIIHRDLKWSNAMVVPQGHDPLFTKLIDFGILKVALDGSSGDQRRELTRTGVLLGTPQYMSPEAICGQPLDGRADQYSLGVMAYELFTGRRPFESESRLELLRQHVQDPPPPMRDIGPARGEHPALEAAIRRALAKSPGDRFPTISAFHAALARAVGLAEPSAAAAAPQHRRISRAGGATPQEVPRTDAGPLADPTGVRSAPPRAATPSAAFPPAGGPPPGPVRGSASPQALPRWPAWAWGLAALALLALGFGLTRAALGTRTEEEPSAGGDPPHLAATVAAAAPREPEAAAPRDEGLAREAKRLSPGSRGPSPEAALPPAADRESVAAAAPGAVDDGAPAGAPAPEDAEPRATSAASQVSAPATSSREGANGPTASAATAGTTRRTSAPPWEPGASSPRDAREVATTGAEAATADRLAAQARLRSLAATTAARVEGEDPPASVTHERVTSASGSAATAASATGLLTIVATPYAEVHLDGVALGTTPLRARSVGVGRHTVELRHPTYGTQLRTVTVRADATAVLTVDMRP